MSAEMKIEERILALIVLLGPMATDELSESLGIHTRTVMQRADEMLWDRKLARRYIASGSEQGRYKWCLP